MSRCAIMQPTYLPWAGYFNLIANVDDFVFLDDVQFDRRSWQVRNRIVEQGQVSWLTCPVQKAPRDTALQDIKLSSHQDWAAKHTARLQHSYAQHPHFDDIQPVIALLQSQSWQALADLNIALITLLAEQLGLITRFWRASQLNVGGRRTQHLIALCQALEATQYLSPPGSQTYLADDGDFADTDITLQFQDYTPAVYTQHGCTQWHSHMSVIDVIANIGLGQTAHYVQEAVNETV